MRNIELFNEFVLQIFDKLYDSFPVPCVIDPDDFIARVKFSPYPPRPVDSYCGPDMSWFFLSSSEDDETEWETHPWETIRSEVEAFIGRPLTEFEKNELLRTGNRPLTEDEQNLLTNWESKKREVDALRITQKVQREETERKQAVFIATLQFLTSENFIRFTDPQPSIHEKKVLNPTDILISKATKRLRFVLTSYGFTHLNSIFKDGKLTQKMTHYQVIKRALKDKAVEGASSVVMQVIVGSILA